MPGYYIKRHPHALDAQQLCMSESRRKSASNNPNTHTHVPSMPPMTIFAKYL